MNVQAGVVLVGSSLPEEFARKSHWPVGNSYIFLEGSMPNLQALPVVGTRPPRISKATVSGPSFSVISSDLLQESWRRHPLIFSSERRYSISACPDCIRHDMTHDLAESRQRTWTQTVLAGPGVSYRQSLICEAVVQRSREHKGNDSGRHAA